MAKITNELKVVNIKNETKNTKDGEQKTRSVKLMVKDDEGVTISYKISGPRELVEQRLSNFVIDSGAPISVQITNIQTTLTSQINKVATSQKPTNALPDKTLEKMADDVAAIAK